MPNHRLNKNVPELFTIQNNLLSCKELSKNLPANSITRCNANKHYAFIEKDKPKSQSQPQPQFQPESQSQPQSQAQPQFQPESQFQPQFQPESQSQKIPPVPPSVTQEFTETLNQYGLGHIAPTLVNVNISAAVDEKEDDTSDDPLWSKVIKEKVKAAKKMGLDHYVKYDELTPTEVEAAKMTKASYINLREGEHASQAYANEHLKGWKLDTTLSDEHTSVFVSKEGKVAIAYRGTQAGRDWATNAKLALGLEESSKQIQEIEKTFEKITQKYPRENIEFISGHSKGGGQAIYMGNKHGIPTITQDPALTPKMIAKSNPNVHHVINRTPTDWVSGLTSAAKELRNNISERLIDPTKGSGILGSHDLNLMTHFDYEPKSGQGDTEYNPRAKDKAFIAKHIQDGMTLDDIKSLVGQSSPSATQNLVNDFNEVSNNPSKDYLKEAGYSTSSPTLRNTLQNTLVNQAVNAVESATSNVGTMANQVINRSTGANILTSVVAAQVLNSVGVDDEMAALVGGGLGNVAAERIGERIGLNTILGGRSISLRNAFTIGVIGGEMGNEARTHAYNTLTDLGVDHDSATILSSGASGGIQSAAEYQANVAIAYAERQYGRGVVSTAVRSAITRGVERAGLAEVAGIISGEAVTGASRGRWGGWVGTLLGVGIGVGTGVVEVLTAEQEQEIYAIMPSVFQGPDQAVGTDSEIIRIMREFNDSHDFSDEKIQQVEAQLDARVQTMKSAGVLGMVLPSIQLQRVPEHTIDQGSNVMLAGTYTERALEEFQNQRLAQLGPTAEEIARIQAMPAHSAMSSIVNRIIEDAEYTRLIHSPRQDIHAINMRIRQVIEEGGTCDIGQRCNEDFYAILQGVGDFPQLDENGNWMTLTIHDPIPTEPNPVQNPTAAKDSALTRSRQAALDAATLAERERFVTVAREETEQIESAQQAASDIYNVNPVSAPTLEDDQNIPLGRS